MNGPSFIRLALSHGAALLIGFGGYALLPIDVEPPAAPPTTHPTSGGRNTKRGSRANRPLSSNEAFRETWKALATCPMSASERRELRRKLLADWAERDPQGLLAFLKKTRVWPEEISIHQLGNLNHARPDMLLNFAIRHGSTEAIRALNNTDPETVIRLIEAIPPGERGKEMNDLEANAYKTLGMAGVVVATPTADYIAGQVKALLEEGRLAEFREMFAKIDDDKLRAKAAYELRRAIAYGKLDDEILETVASLPVEFQGGAVESIFGHNTWGIKFPAAREECREEIRKMIERGVTAGVETAVQGLFYKDDRETVNRETIEWLTELPQDESWKGIETEALSRWFQFDRDAMADAISALPAGASRERLAESAAMVVLRLESSESAQSIIIRLIALSSNPELQKLLEQPKTPADPFADPFAEPVDDPFADPPAN